MAFVGDGGRPGSSGKARSRSPAPRWGTQRTSGARDAMEDEDELDPDEQDEEGEDEEGEEEQSDAESAKRPLEKYSEGEDRAAKRTRTSRSPEASEGSPTSPTSPRQTNARGSASRGSGSSTSTSRHGANQQPPPTGWASRMRVYESARRENGGSESGEAGEPPATPQAYAAPFHSTSHAISNQMGIKTQAVFVGKLYAMLEDEDIKRSGLIGWSADGNVFSCLNPTEFSRVVLPQFFKHNNWQSFVRQLNMYGFNKVNDLVHTSSADPQAWEFRHPNFRRGQPELLASIKRKSTKTTANVPRTPPFSTAPKPNDSPKDYFQQEPLPGPPPESLDETWQSEMPTWVAASSSASSPAPRITLEAPVRSQPPPGLYRSTSHLSAMRPVSSAGSREQKQRAGPPPSVAGPSTAQASTTPVLPISTPRPTTFPEQHYRGASQSSSSWSGSRAAPAVPPAIEHQMLQNAVLEAQLREQMRKLHRERLDNRASAIGFISMLQRLLEVLHTELRSPHAQVACREIAGILSKQQVELGENYSHLVETQNQQKQWDAVADQIRSEFHASHVPAPPATAPPLETYSSLSAPPPLHRDRHYREDTLPAFAAQGLPPLNLDRSNREQSPGTEAIRRRVFRDNGRRDTDQSSSRSNLDGILNR